LETKVAIMSTKKRLNDATPDEWTKVSTSWVDDIRPDMVNSPEHYNKGGIECIEYIKQQLGDCFTEYCEGNVIKYLHRWRYKNGTEDLKKAQWYLNEMIEWESE